MMLYLHDDKDKSFLGIPDRVPANRLAVLGIPDRVPANRLAVLGIPDPITDMSIRDYALFIEFRKNKHFAIEIHNKSMLITFRFKIQFVILKRNS